MEIRKNITIRTASVEDASRLLEIYTYYVVNTAVSFECEPPSLDEFRRRISTIKKKYPYIVIEDEGIIKGYAYAGPFVDRAAYDRSCEVTIYLDHEYRGQGLGRDLYKALETALRDQGMLNLYAKIGDPIVDNDEYLTKDSERFHEKMGYIKVAEFHECGYKFGRWYNMICAEKMIGEHY